MHSDFTEYLRRDTTGYGNNVCMGKTNLNS